MPLYNANDIDPLNEFWNFLNRQFSGEFKLGTFVKAVSDVANSASTVANASLPLAGGTMTGDIVLDGAGVDSAAAVGIGTSTATAVNVGTAVGCAVSIGESTGTTTIYSALAMDNSQITGLANGSLATDAAALGQLSSQFVSVAVGAEAAHKRIISGTFADSTGNPVAASNNCILELYCTVAPTVLACEALGGTNVASDILTKHAFLAFQTAADGTFAIGVTFAGATDVVYKLSGLSTDSYVSFTTFD